MLVGFRSEDDAASLSVRLRAGLWRGKITASAVVASAGGKKKHNGLSKITSS